MGRITKKGGIWYASFLNPIFSGLLLHWRDYPRPGQPVFSVCGAAVRKRTGTEAVTGTVCGIFSGLHGGRVGYLSAYVLPYTDSFWYLLAVGLFLPFTGPVANLVWLFAGATLQKLFSQYQKTVDIVLAVSLVLCAVTLVWPH